MHEHRLSSLRAPSIMSTSETHSENAASDDEDFKSNIPYFDDAPNVASTQPNSYESMARSTLESISGDDDEPGNFNYPTWDNDDGFMEVNLSNLDTDYASTEAPYPASESAGEFFSPSNSIAAAAAMATATGRDDDDAMPDIKYSPSEMVLRPPSSSLVQYNYNYPPPPSAPPHARQLQQQQQQQQSPSTPHSYPTHSHSNHAHGMGGHAQAHPHAQYGGPAAYAHHPPGFHPNMWYPNAPYGSTSSYYRPYGAHRYGHYGGGYAHDPMMDMLQLSNSGREARNRAEKNRRDKLNGSIQELSTMVPHVAESPRRVDKTAVLRFAAHGLRLQYVFGDNLDQPRPQITDSLMRLLDSFFITITCHGQIVLISSSIEQHLGHCQADLYGQNILSITHPEDHSTLKQQLIPTDLENLFDVQPDDESGEPRPRTPAEEEYIDKRLREDKRSFTVRLARAGPRSEPTAYEVVKLDGNFRRSDAAPRGIKTSPFPAGLQLIRRSRGRDDAIPLHTISGNDIVLIAIARIIRPPRAVDRVMEANSMEYRTRHLIDGRIIDCDQRIGLVAGYMTDEVRNLSPFTFMHQDDVRWVIVALRQMYDHNSSYGESTYRLITRNGNFIYLQSKGYLEINKETNKVHSFVCVNTLLDEEEGKRRVQDMKLKFSIIINKEIPQSSIDAPASENPQQLEKAVLCLIQNLQNPAMGDDDDDDEDDDSSVGSSENNLPPHASAAMARTMGCTVGGQPLRAAVSYAARSTKTPPLALVPPEASSVKTSISKSVSVVNVSAAKLLRDHQRERVKSPLSDTAPPAEGCERTTHCKQDRATCDCTGQGNGDECCDFCQTNGNQMATTSTATAATATAGVKRSHETDAVGCHELKLSKRRLKSTEIEHVLTSSLDQLGRTLDQQLNAAIELRDQSNRYEVPNTNQRIDEIMEEHQIQSKIYVNIKSEYEVQIQNKSIDANTTKSTAMVTAIAATATDPQRHSHHSHHPTRATQPCDDANDDDEQAR